MKKEIHMQSKLEYGLLKFSPRLAEKYFDFLKDEEADQVLTYVGILVGAGIVIAVLINVFRQASDSAEGVGGWFN